MPRFTIKDLLIATTLIAIGTGMIVSIFQGTAMIWLDPMGDWGALPFLLLWIGGGGIIGAGLFTPFRHPWVGAATGAIVQTLWPVLFFVSSEAWTMWNK